MKSYLRTMPLLLLLAVLLCGCGKKSETPVEPETPEPTVTTEESTSVFCCDGTHTLRFRRNDQEDWQWIDDVSFPLDGQYVDQLIEAARTLDVLPAVPDPEPPAFYGLLDSNSYLSITRSDESEIVYRIGNEAEGGGYYCNSSDDEERIRVVPDSVVALLGRSIYDMALLPEFPDLSAKQIKSVTITRDGVSDCLTVSRGKWLRDKTVVSDFDAVSRLAAGLEDLSVLRCVDYAPSAGAWKICGLDPAAATLEVETGKASVTIYVGGYDEADSAYYVTIGDDPTIYLIGGELPALVAGWTAGN